MFIKKTSLILFVIAVFLTVSVKSFAGEYKSNIQSIVLEDFELQEDGNPGRYWTVVPNRFGRKGNVDSGESLQRLAWVKAWPEEYFGNEVPEKGRGEFFYGPPSEKETAATRYTDVSGSSLGIYLAFNRPGYNFVELYPLAEKDGKYEKTPIQFKGKVEQIDFWVWGSNYNYYMEMVLMDYRGVEHRLDLGTIRHIGWKNIVIQLPNYIPQSVVYIPSGKALSLVKLVIWTYPTEKVSGAYLYLDHIKYLTDVREELYDGYLLGDPEHAQELWDKGVSQPNESDILP